MRKITLLLFFVLSCCISKAQSIQTGYHGFVDLGYNYYISQLSPSTIELTTSHGYQFNPYFFLGAGLGFDFTGEATWGEVDHKPYNKRESKVDIPIFFNLRANFTKTMLTPFVDGKVGAYINNEGGIYANFSLGCRYSINNGNGISVSVGYEMRKVTVEQLEMVTGNKYNNYNYSIYYSERPDQSVDGFVFKVGFDF